MGWLFTHGQTRADIIACRVSPWENDNVSCKTIDYAVCMNVLWSVNVLSRDGKEFERYIGCDLLAKHDGSWGYKDMCEAMGPCYYSCPLRFLDMVPVASAEWREKVKEYHGKRQRKLEVGKTYELLNCKIPHVKISNLRPLRGEYNGTTYRLSKTLIGEVIVPSWSVVTA
jgi:hypothetical protein